MNFDLSEEHLMIRDMARDFAEKTLKPGVIERDESQHFPKDLLRQMGELGFLGMMVSPDYQGGGMDTLSYVLALEELAKWDASAAVIASVNNSLVCWGLEKYGTPEQKEKYLPRLATGEILGAFCLSEPEAGSDATQQKTQATLSGDHFILNGTKNWITNANIASVYLVMAQSDPAKKHKGIDCLIVDREMDGFELGPKENKMGIRASDTHSINFNDVRVPVSHRLGEPGSGFYFAMQVLNGGRIGIAAQALGIASGSLATASAYARIRKAFGTEIINHQAIQFKLADMSAEVEAARLLTWKAANDKDQGRDFTASAAMAKLYASKTAMYCASEAIQIHGGNGYVKDYHVERFLRDAKITEIYEGTSEIQRMVIAREIAKGRLG